MQSIYEKRRQISQASHIIYIYSHIVKEAYHRHSLTSCKTQRQKSNKSTADRKATYNGNAAELVSPDHRVIVEDGGASYPARVRVVGEHNQLVLLAPVADEEEAVLHVGHHDTVAQRMDGGDKVGDMLWSREHTRLTSVCSGSSSPKPALTRHINVPHHTNGCKTIYSTDRIGITQ